MVFSLKLIITAVVLTVSFGFASRALPKGPLPASSSSNIEQSEETLKLEKLDAEVKKLRAEIRSLDAVDPETRRLSTLFGAIGGMIGAIIGAIIGVVVALIGRRLNENYKKAQQDKLDQDRRLSRESHNIELFRNLGDENVRGQLAAAAMLVQRLGYLYNKKLAVLTGDKEMERHVVAAAGKGKTSTPDGIDYEEMERRAIAQGLIAVLKEHIGVEKTEPEPDEKDNREEFSKKLESTPAWHSTHPALVKFIADKIVVEMGARPKGRDNEKKHAPPGESPLEEFDFQNVKLTDANWKKVNARHVDFFKADLRKASLKKANLSGAIFYQADLRETKLIEADLRRTILYEADLRGADLENARYDEVTNFSGAKYNADTKKPNIDFSFEKVGAVYQPEKQYTQT